MPNASCSEAPPRSERAAGTDWSRLPGATARLFPSEQMIRLLCRCLPAEQRHGKTAVDVGCGNGRNTLALAALGFERIIAIDPSPALVEQCTRAARRGGRDIDARVGGLPHLPCEAGQADVVVAWGVMFVLGPAEAVAGSMAALARVVKPGGILITDWRADGDYLMQCADRRLDERTFVLNADAPINLAGASYSFWSEPAVRGVHEAAGFDIIDLQHEEIRETRPQRVWRWWQAAARRRGS